MNSCLHKLLLHLLIFEFYLGFSQFCLTTNKFHHYSYINKGALFGQFFDNEDFLPIFMQSYKHHCIYHSYALIPGLFNNLYYPHLMTYLH